MTDCKRIFIDTSLFIYFIENNKTYSEKVLKIFEWSIDENIELVSSVITYMEFLVNPLKEGRKDIRALLKTHFFPLN